MRLVVAAVALAVAVPSAAAFVDVVAAVKPGVVGITTVQTGRALAAQLSGTGFSVGDGHHVVTNFHVVAGDGNSPVALYVMIPGSGAPDRRSANVVLTDPTHDLALVHVDGPALPTLKLRRDPAMVPDGTSIAITGIPLGVALGLVPTTHRGIVSAQPTNVGALPRASLLDPALLRMGRFAVYQLDLVAFPGNSGSPLYRAENGEVIGVINSGFVKGTKEKALTEPTAITYAMPSIYIRDLLEKAKVAVGS